jgi:hypothetical protein
LQKKSALRQPPDVKGIFVPIFPGKVNLVLQFFSFTDGRNK